MANLNSNSPSEDDLLYMLHHVFIPPKLPQQDDSDVERDIALCDLTLRASLEFPSFLSDTQRQKWSSVSRMLRMLLQTTRSLDQGMLKNNILGLDEGGFLALWIHAQNAAIIIRRRKDCMTFESFEVQPLPEAVMEAEGKLLCSYPGPAIELPLDVAQDSAFVEQLASFLVQMDVDELPGAQATTVKAGSKVAESRSTAHPRYITQLLSMILLGIGKEADIERITKRIADDVCWKNARDPWRRSPLWLIIRVAIQTTVDRDIYKQFMIFLQMRLLQLFLDYDLPSELLYVTRIKTSRRIFKLGTAASPLLASMKDLSEDIQTCLQKRWTKEQEEQAHSPSYIPEPSKFKEHTALSLDESRSYLEGVMAGNSYSRTGSTAFLPSHHPRIRDHFDFHKLSPETLNDAVRADSYLALSDFEWLVQERLDKWVADNRHHESACQTLESCLKQYIDSTKIHYASNPEDESMMILTIMELWVALDTIALVQCPLLKSYSPEIPQSFLDPLLLRKGKFIERATRIQVYLRHRHSSNTCATSIYSDLLSENTFSVRYFYNSSELKAIKNAIEEDASRKRNDKRSELRRMNARHAELTKEISNLSCTYLPYVGHRHWQCHRCVQGSKANNLRIDVHEWPLSDHPFEAEAVVFELNCPPVFSIWRRWTYHILRDIGMFHESPESVFRPNTLLKQYSPLAAWSKGGNSDRITLASETKSFLNAHYRNIKIPAPDDQVCVNNGLRFQLYDSANGELVRSTFAVNLDAYCTFHLHGDGEHLYRGLQYAITHTTHPHNGTIVNQGDCPPNLNMHEHLAFSNLRSGSQLQWMNIARELHTNVLTLSREEVHMLIMQAAWQIGILAADGRTREWHVELGVPEFGRALIKESMNILLHVEGNWTEEITVKSIVYLVSRLLVSIQDNVVQAEAHTLLRKARDVTHKWMREIVDKLQAAVDHDQVNELQRRACTIAAICRATFDVHYRDLDALLCLEEDVAMFIESTVIVHDNTPPHLGDTPQDLQRLIRRDRRLSYTLEKRLSDLVRSDLFKRGMDTAIGRIWPGYRSGVGWNQLDERNSRWITSSTASLDDKLSQQVHYNILDGTLLIDGRQLGRLPRDIIEHVTYMRIFGQKILDVIPSDMPGMDYATRSAIDDCKMFFSLRGSDLIIKAQTSSGRELQLIPNYILHEDLPRLFSTEYVHWMDIKTGIIEFRPLNAIWKESERNWRLVFSKNGPSRLMLDESGRRLLVDIRSSTFKRIAARLSPLELSQYLTVSHDSDFQSDRISIELPRFRLSFFLSDGEIESKNLHGMVIDSNQCTGTMIGLRNQLVLCHKNSISASLPRSRCVIIPFGDVRYTLSPDKNHVCVKIDTVTHFRRQVHWYRYEIDSDLGLLVGNVNLSSRLYRIYLHALCSHPLPDPLTRQKGTDHALQELSAAASFSFQRVADADLELLRLIGKITPQRCYYPKHLQSMQTTEWSPSLLAISQHAGFDVAVGRIMHYAKSLMIFSAAKLDLNSGHNNQPLLMARAMHRNAIYYEGCVNKSEDVRYLPRDSPHVAQYDSSGFEALRTSRLVYAWPRGLTRHLGLSELLDTFEGFIHVEGPIHQISLAYTKAWLGLDLSKSWLDIYDLCYQGSGKKFELVFSLAALAYSTPNPQKYITLLLSFATIPKSVLVSTPLHRFYDLADKFEPIKEKIKEKVLSGRVDIDVSPSGLLEMGQYESSSSFHRRRQNHYDDETDHRINRAVDSLLNQRYCEVPQSPFSAFDDPKWFKIEKIMDEVGEYFTSCSHNRVLQEFTSQITRALQSNYVDPPAPVGDTSKFRYVPELIVNDQPYLMFGLESLLLNRPAPDPIFSTYNFGVEEPAKFQEPGEPLMTLNVEELISQFRRNCCSTFAKAYSERLENSRMQLDGQRNIILPQTTPPLSICIKYRNQCQRYQDIVFSSISSIISPVSTAEEILKISGLWPPIHRRALLGCLASTTKLYPSAEWVESLISFAGLFISYQYSQRLVSYAHRLEVDNFYKEVQNASFNWSDARKNPDWLLIQIQGNFITRALQSEIAHKMVASDKNIVLQLNMGEGKSHVIVPLVTVALADSNKLVRVVVSKPLAGQMFHLLAERISGLTNRRVFYLPFSRDVKVDVEHVQRIRELFEECARLQGVMVAQPEHILSFRLMVIDQLTSKSSLTQSAQDLQKVQAWLNSTSCDVLDESDELLHIRYQLIYTVGEQQPFDGGPNRWAITQKVLDLMRRHMKQLYAIEEFFEEVEVLDASDSEERASAGRFPHIRLMGSNGSNASRELVSRIAEDAVSGKLDHLIFVGLNPGSDLRHAVLCFIKERNISQEMSQTVENTYRKSGLWKGLLLLRGLLAHGILTYVLSQQRWRVDYGLDSGRSLLAVPYRAKDMPSLRSEFGHPDVAICLTCLSYYYGGLTFDQVKECFDLLIKLDNPPLEYEAWVTRGGNDVPESFRLLIGVNMKDGGTFKNVVRVFQHNQATIDFFLSQVVFPKEAKEFASKLGTSGWDLAEKKVNPTTGFSGTNDNKDLLPTSINPTDTVKQLATNAQVLEYLLRAENERYVCTQSDNGQPCSVTEFIDLLIQEPREVRVLLDVGAQMLEMTNQQLVTHWMGLTKDEVAAGVFFDDADQLSVISKDGVIEPLYSSPFYQRLNECIVYLDDAHTRGTDLKLPPHYRAAVTLGPKITKDRLVQGCMRMRKLGHGQSVLFCAPPEVDKRIRETQKLADSETVKVMDVLSWVMSRTCDDIEDHVPHWVEQGVDHHNRKALDFTASTSSEEIERLKEAWLQPAARSLDDMYGVSNVESPSFNSVDHIPEMRQRLDDLRVEMVRDARMEEEQEREVSHELEQERQVERPPKVKPAEHHLDNEVCSLVQSGVMPTKPINLLPLMTPLSTPSVKLRPQNPWSKELLCTRDFMTTTQNGKEKTELTSYLRPVQWILSHMRRDGRMILIVMSPYEVNALLKDIRNSKYVRLHMYAPRTTQAMKPLDGLMFYCIPPLPQGDNVWTPPSLDVRCQLNIWGGQLYLGKYETYLRLCLLLGISSSELEGYTSVESDRFVSKAGRVGEMVQACLFDESPIALLKTLFGLRRKGMGFDLTHMGRILSARLVLPEHFDERACKEGGKNVERP